jgi:hypothetical protein
MMDYEPKQAIQKRCWSGFDGRAKKQQVACRR